MAVFSSVVVRISVRAAAHWLQTSLFCLIRTPNLPLHSQFAVKDVAESMPLAMHCVWLEKALV